ncbi:MAG: fasciclin domain-containing protein [Acidimicrobiia bacterium]|nr:fasciclin domain-containing protein [Acidimicrobiia bacterium]MBT8246754.1 fasciclin domain-containing protein [Acidimicrobiia bacterium]NNJ46356.1 fasciclin domain-containing protein [Acidimicrobiia bacterium]NNL96689.1 fasciclin domain-containing protein [Acidimicrobiia bacterium]
MKRTKLFTATAMLAIFALVAAACSSDEDADPTTTTVTTVAAEEMGTIVDVAAGAGTFETLLVAATAAGLADTLAGDGPFTVFAPTDEAFAALPEGTVEGLLEDPAALSEILLYHVVPGKVLAADVVSLTSATTVQGSDVTISVDGGAVMIDGANVTATDIEASNGVIHVIDAVILPSA